MGCIRSAQNLPEKSQEYPTVRGRRVSEKKFRVCETPTPDCCRTETVAVQDGYAAKNSISWGGGGGGFFGAGFGLVGSGYDSTDIGRIVTLAFIQAYSRWYSTSATVTRARPAPPKRPRPRPSPRKDRSRCGSPSSPERFKLSCAPFNRNPSRRGSAACTRLVWIEAAGRVQDRFYRHLKRARDRDVKSLKDFVDQDEEQMQFGVLRAGPDIADVVLRNDQDIDTFHAKVLGLARSRLPAQLRSIVPVRIAPMSTGLGRSWAAPRPAKKYPNGLQGLGLRFGNTTRNRALKEVPEFAIRMEPSGGKLLRYRITSVGQTLLSLLNRGIEAR